jgi:hypothetical protein
MARFNSPVLVLFFESGACPGFIPLDSDNEILCSYRTELMCRQAFYEIGGVISTART